MGLQSTIFRIFGFVPGPIVFGVAIDASCKFWNYEFPCGSSTPVLGACWEYNKEELSNYFMAMTVVAIGLSLIFSFLSWATYPSAPQKNKEKFLPEQKVMKTVGKEEVGETSEREEMRETSDP